MKSMFSCEYCSKKNRKHQQITDITPGDMRDMIPSAYICLCSIIFGLGAKKTTVFINLGTWPMTSGSVFHAFFKSTIITEDESGFTELWHSKRVSV